MLRFRLNYLNHHPRKIVLLPPGGCRTRNDGRSVRAFPPFILFPFAKVLLDTRERLELEFEVSSLLFDCWESAPSLTASLPNRRISGTLISPFSPSHHLRLMELLPPYKYIFKRLEFAFSFQYCIFRAMNHVETYRWVQYTGWSFSFIDEEVLVIVTTIEGWSCHAEIEVEGIINLRFLWALGARQNQVMRSAVLNILALGGRRESVKLV